MDLVWCNLKGDRTLSRLHRAGRLGVRNIDVDGHAHRRQILLQERLDVRQSHLRVADVDGLLVVVASGQHGEFATAGGRVGKAALRDVRKHLVDDGAIIISGPVEVTL